MIFSLSAIFPTAIGLATHHVSPESASDNPREYLYRELENAIWHADYVLIATIEKSEGSRTDYGTIFTVFSCKKIEVTFPYAFNLNSFKFKQDGGNYNGRLTTIPGKAIPRVGKRYFLVLTRESIWSYPTMVSDLVLGIVENNAVNFDLLGVTDSLSVVKDSLNAMINRRKNRQNDEQ